MLCVQLLGRDRGLEVSTDQFRGGWQAGLGVPYLPAEDLLSSKEAVTLISETHAGFIHATLQCRKWSPSTCMYVHTIC